MSQFFGRHRDSQQQATCARQKVKDL